MLWDWLGAGWRWLRANTFVPSWLPTRLRHPATVYVLAIVGQACAVLLTRFLMRMIAAFAFPTLLALLWVALVALRWGGGPGLLATLSGTVFVEGGIERFHGGTRGALAVSLLEVGLFLAVGSIISVLASAIERARRQAVREQAEAQAANRRMEQFLSIASHELRTPLTTMQLSVQQAERRLVQRPLNGAEPTARAQAMETVQSLLASNERSLGRLTRLVDDLLDASRVRVDQLQVSLAGADLAAIVTEVVQEQRAMHPNRSIGLEPPVVPVVPVRADAARIGQVVSNYLSNALKYSPADRPVAVRIEVGGEQASVAVQDQGPGLPPEEQSRIWELFHRAPGIEVQSGSGVGLGLGLHICKAIIERHGGQVGVESTAGQGATFWFTLPLAGTGDAET